MVAADIFAGFIAGKPVRVSFKFLIVVDHFFVSLRLLDIVHEASMTLADVGCMRKGKEQKKW